jgi:NodT family efflux transporter outer membrane factor (OMF) lipoprotein
MFKIRLLKRNVPTHRQIRCTCERYLLLLKGLEILLLLFLVVSCNPHLVDRDIQPLVEGSDAYSLQVEGIDPQSRWWEALNDRYLNTFITEALSGNLTLKQAHARIEQAIAVEKEAGSWLSPDVSGDISAEGEGKSRGKPDYQFNAAVDLSWEVDLWNRLSSARQAAGYEVLASRDELEAAAMILTAEIAEVYFQIVEQKLQLALLERQIEAGETFLELIELRFGYGEVSVVDVYQQRQQLASTRAQAPIVKAELKTHENRLAVLLGTAPSGRSAEIADDFPMLPLLPEPGIPSDLLTRRPDLKSIHKRLVAFDYRVAEAVANRLPRFQLGGSTGFEWTQLTSEALFLSLFAEATAPILDGERRKAEIEKREAVLKEALANYSHAYLIAIEEVENALWQGQHHGELLDALERQLTIARSNLRETRHRYLQGLTDYLPVLTALQSLQQLERDILSERREAISIRILLYRALGGSRLMTEAMSRFS